MDENLGLASRDLLDGETEQRPKLSQCETRHCTMLQTPASNAIDDGHQACQNEKNQTARINTEVDTLNIRHAPFACLSRTTPKIHL